MEIQKTAQKARHLTSYLEKRTKEIGLYQGEAGVSWKIASLLLTLGDRQTGWAHSMGEASCVADARSHRCQERAHRLLSSEGQLRSCFCSRLLLLLLPLWDVFLIPLVPQGSAELSQNAAGILGKLIWLPWQKSYSMRPNHKCMSPFICLMNDPFGYQVDLHLGRTWTCSEFSVTDPDRTREGEETPTVLSGSRG